MLLVSGTQARSTIICLDQSYHMLSKSSEHKEHLNPVILDVRVFSIENILSIRSHHFSKMLKSNQFCLFVWT